MKSHMTGTCFKRMKKAAINFNGELKSQTADAEVTKGNTYLEVNTLFILKHKYINIFLFIIRCINWNRMRSKWCEFAYGEFGGF